MKREALRQLKMKIVALERSGLLYGSAFNLIQWAEYLITKKQVSVELLLAEDGEFAAHSKKTGIGVDIVRLPERLNQYGKRNLRFPYVLYSVFGLLFLNVKCLVKCLSKLRAADLIVCNNYRSYVYFFLVLVYARFFLGKKIILRLQTSDTPLSLFRKGMPLVFNKIIIHGTKGYASKAFGASLIARRETFCLPNPVDTEEYQPNSSVREKLRRKYEISPDTCVFICVAYIEPRKGIKEMIQAFNTADLPDSILVHIGDAGSHHEYQEQVEKESSSRILFLGRRNDVKDLLNMADCFVLFSEYEGMPYAVVEAMSSGLPVLVTDVGSNSEVVTPDCGDVIDWPDKKALTKKFIEYASNLDVAREKGRSARNRVISFYSCEKYFSRLEEIYFS